MSREARLMKFLIGLDARMRTIPLLAALRRGMTAMIPLLLTGSFAIVLLSLPIPQYQRQMGILFGSGWGDSLIFIKECTFGIMALLMVIMVSYAYAQEYREYHAIPVNPVIAVGVAVAGFSGIVGVHQSGFSLSSISAMGVFSALISAVLTTSVFLWMIRLRQRWAWTFSNGADSAYQEAVSSIWPAALTLILLAAIQLLMVKPLGFQDMNSLLAAGMLQLFSQVKTPLTQALLFILSVHGFWVFGIHGSNALETVAQLVFVPRLATNYAAVLDGLPTTEIFTKTFFDTFVLMGGCGTTLSLLAAIFLFGKYRSMRRLAQLSLVPVLFNINELVVFGLPIVLNPVFIIPFVGVPLLLTLISWVATAAGLVPMTSYAVEWTTPVLLSGYAATHSITGSLLQAFNLTVGALCYAPFVRVAEIVADVQMKQDLKKLQVVVAQCEEKGLETALLIRQDDVGTIARFLSADLDGAFREKALQLHYQPQHDSSGAINGVEALLRWKHAAYGWIAPPIVIALSEESGLMHRLGPWILNQACRDLKALRDGLGGDLTVSVNITARQIEEADFLETVHAAVAESGIPPEALVLEITERLALTSGTDVITSIRAIQEMGVRLAMDDFGMGHSSLMYLKEYHFDEVKLDGALIRELYDNPNCSSIIRSIVQLGESLNYTVIAEYVEEAGQRDMLLALGCHRYQGYLYSPALPVEALEKYLELEAAPLSQKVSKQEIE